MITMEYFLLDELYPPVGSGVARTPGLHLSDIMDYIEAKLQLTKRNPTDWNRSMLMDAGFVWERYLEMAYAEAMADRIGEVEEAGIIMSPDGLTIDDEGLIDADNHVIVEPSHESVLEEYKWTWRSSKHMPWNEFRWMMQIKSYAYALRLHIVIMRIAYVHGNYAGSGPIYRVAWFKFTQEELDKNWEMILKHKPLVIKEMKKDGRL